MNNETLDQAVQGVLGAPIIRQIVLDLKPDMDKLREAIGTALKGVAKAREEELVKDWEEANVGKDNETSAAVWSEDSEADHKAIERDKKCLAELSRLFNKLQAVATPGEMHVIFEENAWAGFGEVVMALRRHNIPLPKIT